MKLIIDNVFNEIKLTNRERVDFNKINKLKEKVLKFIIFILIIAFFLLIYFLKLKNKDIKESINKLNEIKNNMRIYTNNLIKKNVELKHNLKKANSYNDNLLKQKPLFVKYSECE